jgi:TolB protein
MSLKKIISLGIFIAAATLILLPQQNVYIKITEGMPAISLAFPEFIVRAPSAKTTEAAAEIYQTLSADLKFSRIFQLSPKSYYSYIRPLNPGKIFFKDWESIQANILFVGEISAGEGESIVFEGRLFDVKSERFIIGKSYQAKKDVFRLIAHKMADEILKVYGEKPVFTSKIVFVSDRDGGDFELYMMDCDGQNQRRLTFNKVKDYMPAWSPDGKKIAFTSYRRTRAGLYIWNLEANSLTEVASSGTAFSPSFSPDGTRLLFCSTLEGNSEIFVASGDGKNVKRLTFNNAVDTAPSWSPTGREIVFTSDRGGTPQIYIMDAEGSNVRRISFGGTYHDSPAWSPAGDRIVYVSRVENIFDLYVLNLRSNQIIKLTESNARNESPSWSPDGRHIVFTSTVRGTSQIYMIDYDGANLHSLTSKGNNKLPDWSSGPVEWI